MIEKDCFYTSVLREVVYIKYLGTRQPVHKEDEKEGMSVEGTVYRSLTASLQMNYTRSLRHTDNLDLLENIAVRFVFLSRTTTPRAKSGAWQSEGEGDVGRVRVWAGGT